MSYKKYTFTMVLIIIILSACSPQGNSDSTGIPIPTGESSESIITTTTASPAEVDPAFGLLFMREEEKLAHDVYILLHEKWGLRIFQNIANSEQQHTDAVASLLLAYDLPDPSEGKSSGQFSDPTLQVLYDELIGRGTTSLVDAIKVGAAIEEIDIRDLQEYLEMDLPADVRQVYENLLVGSYNHLVSFTSTLERQTGEIYTPQYMSIEAYNDALAQGATTGRGGGGYWEQTPTP